MVLLLLLLVGLATTSKGNVVQCFCLLLLDRIVDELIVAAMTHLVSHSKATVT